MLPLAVGTMALFDVIVPSGAFNVDTDGCVSPLGHSVGEFVLWWSNTVQTRPASGKRECSI